MLEKWEASAENLIAHFAVICQGHEPFFLDWSTGENAVAGDLDPVSALYMVDLKAILSSMNCKLYLYNLCSMRLTNMKTGPDFEGMNPETARVQPYFWVSKIFRPRTMHVTLKQPELKVRTTEDTVSAARNNFKRQMKS
jgi:hypothetical protein